MRDAVRFLAGTAGGCVSSRCQRMILNPFLTAVSSGPVQRTGRSGLPGPGQVRGAGHSCGAVRDLNQWLAVNVTTGMTGTQPAASGQAQQAALGRWPRLALRMAGAALLGRTGAIHLDLYLTGYRSIPTIGWLFLLQVIAAFGLAALVAVSGSRLASAAGAAFALSTLGGYLLSIWIGLFGFTEVRTTAGIVAGVVEVAAFAALAVCAWSQIRAPGRTAVAWCGGPAGRPPADSRGCDGGSRRGLRSGPRTTGRRSC